MEAVILSVPPAYVSVLKKRGRRSGHLLKSLHRNIDQPLAAILTLNTIANTFGSMGVGFEVNRIYGNTHLAAASGLLTFCILIFSEIVPKTIGALHCKRLAPVSAYIISVMIIITYPFVLLSRGLNKLLSGGLRRQSSREEMIAAAEMSADEGVIHQKEGRIIKNLLMLDSIEVSEIMTPRSVVNSFSADLTVGEVIEKFKPVRFSRNPVFIDNLDNVIGLLLRYKLMEAVANDHDDIKLDKIMTPIHRIHESTSVSKALDQFIKRREHLFLVIDDNGTTEGIVTLEDAVETLLGVEIVDEFDSVEDMRQFALDQWRLKKKALLAKKSKR